MALGKKTGGRTKGTPNKRTADVIDRLERLGCDPLEGLARIAMDPESPPELRGRLYAELLQYVAPKRRALDVNASEAPPISIRIGIPQATVPNAVQSTPE